MAAAAAQERHLISINQALAALVRFPGTLTRDKAIGWHFILAVLYPRHLIPAVLYPKTITLSRLILYPCGTLSQVSELKF